LDIKISVHLYNVPDQVIAVSFELMGLRILNAQKVIRVFRLLVFVGDADIKVLERLSIHSNLIGVPPLL
jgi:hypothetical protein